MKYLVINYGTNNVETKQNFEAYKEELKAKNVTFEEKNARELNYLDFLKSLNEEDELVLCGGDGTINFFVNAIEDYEPKNNIYYYPLGTGNDFAHDVLDSTERKEVLLNQYIKDLPTVYVNDRKMKFLNNVGFGIDGYCCEVGDSLKGKTDKPINYAGIAIKGILFHFKPAAATVKVDGVEQKFDQHIWLATTMKGRFYGGGMMAAPAQNRLSEDKKVTLVTYYKKGKLGTLFAFPKFSAGKHDKVKKVVQSFTGNEIEVTFDRPCACQVDGETILNVTTYKVSTK